MVMNPMVESVKYHLKQTQGSRIMPHQNGSRHQTANDPHPWCLLFLHFGIAHRLQSSGGACRMTRCHRYGHKWGSLQPTERQPTKPSPKGTLAGNICFF